MMNGFIQNFLVIQGEICGIQNRKDLELVIQAGYSKKVLIEENG
jgi:hypothetical protein